MTITYLLISVFAVLCVGLGVYIVYLLRQNKQRQRKNTNISEAYAASALKQRSYLIDSIRIISRGILEEQCPLAEGCIRIKVLLDNLSPQMHQQDSLAVIELVYGKTEHIPMLDDWKSLSSEQKRKYQQELEAVEQQHAEAIRAAAKLLRDYPFEQMAH
ncbi:DUF2489 domain-containing protein [Nitrincola iocasae]|uniref:DUF2489 domain-containing protein n=1 Tax=Nitrincola iocasae TaxID=2614693 RepID=A0A5J6LAL3_9GAMM|nr:DUF2489 domain-containing protein [Nitrincola iocasae]QEW05411.1 DUF2489 domain-containing protein [Nitrincola iocasae]